MEVYPCEKLSECDYNVEVYPCENLSKKDN